jgi:hypothetical protein
MRPRFRHPELGYYHKLDLSKGHIRTMMVADASLDGLVRYLNNAEKRGDANTVLKIVDLMLTLQQVDSEAWGTKEERVVLGDAALFVWRNGMTVPNPLLKKVAREKYDKALWIAHRQLLLNRELAKYRFIPVIFPLQDDQWIVQWKTSGHKWRKPRRGLMPLEEAAALQMILDLARARSLGRLRRCSHCGKWLYANFRHQTFCSTKCQQTHYGQSEEWKRKRRDYMRAYRQQTK